MSCRSSGHERASGSNSRRHAVAVRPEPRRRSVDRALQQDRRPIVQRVGQRRVRMDPLQAVLRQRELLEARRADRHGMHRGADVVHEAGQRQLGRPRAAADRHPPLREP